MDAQVRWASWIVLACLWLRCVCLAVLLETFERMLRRFLAIVAFCCGLNCGALCRRPVSACPAGDLASQPVGGMQPPAAAAWRLQPSARSHGSVLPVTVFGHPRSNPEHRQQQDGRAPPPMDRTAAPLDPRFPPIPAATLSTGSSWRACCSSRWRRRAAPPWRR